MANATVLRHQFELLFEDTQALDGYGCPWEAIIDGSHWILIHQFPTRNPGYNLTHVTAAIRIETGYPDVGLDMVYFFPPLSRTDGKKIAASEATQTVVGQLFQRWSRHYTSEHPWVPGVNNLLTHIWSIEAWLDREFQT